MRRFCIQLIETEPQLALIAEEKSPTRISLRGVSAKNCSDMEVSMKRNIIRRVVFLILCIIWMGIIFYMSSKSGDDSSGMSHGLVNFVTGIFPFLKVIPFEILNFLIRKGAHFTEYGLFALWIIGFLWTFDAVRDRYVALGVAAVGFCAFYAATDEVHQGFVSGRSPKFTDVIIDSSGALTFSIICLVIMYVIKRKTSRS